MGLAPKATSVTFVNPAPIAPTPHVIEYRVGVPVVTPYGKFAEVDPTHAWGNAPSVIVGAGFMLIVTVDVAGPQGPAPSGSFVVKVNITEPLVMLGVYVDVNEVTFEKVPLGALHVELVALPPIVPARVTVPPAQTG